MHDTTTTRALRARSRTRLVATAALGVISTAALAGAAWSSPAEASTTTVTCTTTSQSTDWKSAVTSANVALNRALNNIDNAAYIKAAQHLRTMKVKTRVAHHAATRLIGRPPTDPESDDPPGVQAVVKVGGLEHRETMALVPLFGDPHGKHAVGPEANGLLTADTCRKVMLHKVIALPGGKRDDYTDDLSDTLPSYKQELSAISTALTSDDLTSGGRTALKQAQQVVSPTQAAMKKAFGGPE